MARKRSPLASSVSSNSQTIFTAGEVFGDGTLIELVRAAPTRNLALLLREGSRIIVGRTITHDSRVYSPAEFDSTLLERVILPVKPRPYGTARKLFDDIAKELKIYLNVPDETARLFAFYSLSTCFTDILAIAPCLSIASPSASEGLAALTLLGCFCRHSLLLGDISANGLQSLPAGLQLSLLISEPSLSKKIQKLLNVSTRQGLSIPQNGKLINLYGAKVIAGRTHPNMLENFIRVAISPRSASQHSLLTRQTLEKLTIEYQGRLLTYRLENLGRVLSAHTNDVAGLTLPLLEVARNLGCCVADKELRSELNSLLKDRDEELRGKRLVEHPSVVLEALLVLCHEGNRQLATVEDIAELVNALLLGRGETVCLSKRKVGAQLGSLQIFTRRFSGGQNRGIDFDLNNRRKIHRLALDYEVPIPLIQAGTQCSQCQEAGQANT